LRRAELTIVREVLEGVVSPTVATAVLYEALEQSKSSPPQSLEEMRAFAKGPLDSAVRRKTRTEDAEELAGQIDMMFSRAIEGDGISVDVDFEDEDRSENADATETAQMAVVKRPVPVLVLSGQPDFPERLVACLGLDRVHAVAVHDPGGLTRATFAEQPLFVLIDASGPVPIDELVLVGALLRLPDSTTPVIWASESRQGQDLLRRAEREGVTMVSLSRVEGIEPLLDLVLSRFAG
jgi:hypothetical protein